MKKVVTLNEFISREEKRFPEATGELSGLLRDIVLASKVINREVNKAGLADILGAANINNASGEDVQKLDMFSHHEFVSALKNSGECCGIVSEESEDIITFDETRFHNAKYVVCTDPLDGSSNIDVNVSIGTIFAIYKRVSTGKHCTIQDFFQKGTELVAAGYVIYGSSTMLVYSTGNGVNGFTLDPSIGEYCLSHPNITIPKKGKIYSINESYTHRFETGIKDYIAFCKEEDKATKRPYSSRYIGSMVADLHRNMIKGGIFIYPAMTTHPNGKLRLLFECNPMAFIIENAGGKATSGKERILEIQPTALHQRTPIIIGSSDMVDEMLTFINTEEMVDA